jgi:alpha-D-ribose 1-methylphosphonate 5-phosphate C-P lyase
MAGSDTPRGDEPDVTAETALAIIGAGVPRRAMAETTLAGFLAVLADEHAFAGLSWPDARMAAEVIAEALCHDNAGTELLNMARDAGAGIGAWRNPAAVARAFTIAAAALS